MHLPLWPTVLCDVPDIIYIGCTPCVARYTHTIKSHTSSFFSSPLYIPPCFPPSLLTPSPHTHNPHTSRNGSCSIKNVYLPWMTAEAVLDIGHDLYSFHMNIKYISVYLCSQTSNILCKMQMAQQTTEPTLAMIVCMNDSKHTWL